MKNYLLIFLCLIYLTICNNYKLNITLEGEKGDEEGEISILKRGIFYPITIRVLFENNTFTTEKAKINISDDTYVFLEQNSYFIDLTENYEINTFIGVRCNPDLPENNPFELKFLSDNSKFEGQSITVKIIINTTELTFINTEPTIGLNTFGAFVLNNSLMNSEEINVKFEITNETLNESLIFEKKELSIINSINPFIHYQQYIKFHANTTENITDIPIKATITSNNNKCYSINELSQHFTINILATKQVSNPKESDLSMIWYLERKVPYFSSINSSNIVPGTIHCAIVASELEMIDDYSILSQTYPDDMSYYQKILFFNTVLGENHKQFKFSLNTLDKYRKYNWKCIYQNNNYNKEENLAIIESNNSINLTKTLLFGFPSCWDGFFTDLSNTQSFDEAFMNYTFFGGLMDDSNGNGCIRLYNRNIDKYYPKEIENNMTLKSYCLYSEPTCNMTKFSYNNMSSAVKSYFIDVLTDNTTIKEKLGLQDNTTVQIEKIQQSDFVSLNSTAIKFKYKNHTKKNITVSFESLIDNSFSCFYNFHEYDKNKTYSFKKKEEQQILVSNEQQNEVTLQFGSDNFDDKIYFISLLCNTLPGIDLLDSLNEPFEGAFIYHSKELEFDCTNNPKSTLCLKEMLNALEYRDLAQNIPNIQDIFESIDSFTNKTFEEKETILKGEIQKINLTEQSSDLIYSSILINEYMYLFDCLESVHYKQCQNNKIENLKLTINKINSAIYTNHSSITDYLNSFDSSESQNIFKILLIQVITLGNIIDALDSETSLLALDFSFKLLNESDTIKSEDSENQETILSLLSKSSESTINIINYMDIQQYFDILKTSSVLSQQNLVMHNFIEHDTVTKYVNILSYKLANILVELEKTTFVNDLFTYKSQKPDPENFIEIVLNNKVNATILSGQQKDSTVSFIVYNYYPSISLFDNGKVFGNVINVNVLNNTDKQLKLSSPINLEYSGNSMNEAFTHCYLIEEGSLSTDGVKMIENNSTSSICQISKIGDVVVTTMRKEYISSSWLITLICVGCAVLLILVIALIRYIKKKKSVIQFDKNSNAEKLFENNQDSE